MRIAINLSAVRSIGTQLYCGGFVHALAREVEDTDKVLLFLSPDAATILAQGLPQNFQVRVTHGTRNPATRLAWEQVVLPLELVRWHSDVLFSPFDISPLCSPCPVLLAIRNPEPALQRLTMPERSRATARLHDQLVIQSCRRASLTMYPTVYASELLGNILGVPPKKRVVVHHGLDADYWRTEEGGQALLLRHSIKPGRYFFFASQHYRYKQTDVLIEAFGLWREGAGRDGYELILTGETPDLQHHEKMQGIIDRMGLRSRVQFLGNVDRSLVRALYQSCAVFVMPSVMETFGHPYVEAMAAGRPLLCADTPVSREICGDAAMYFRPGDSKALSDVLNLMVGDSTLCDSLGRIGRARSGMFSWQREARETLAYLKAAANGTS